MPERITAAEQARRRREVDEVRHSTEMDGGSRTQEAHDDQEAYVRGELTLEDLVEHANQPGARVGEDGAEGLPAERARFFREMADPMRLRIYHVLWVLGEMRASALAKRIGGSEAVVTRNLEAMQTLALVESTRQGTSPRSRVWRAIPDSLPPGPKPGEPVEPEVAAWLKATREMEQRLLIEFVDRRAQEPAEWQNATMMGNEVLHLTPAELDELSRELRELVRKWTQRARARERDGLPADARAVYVVTHAVLMPHPGPNA